MATQSLVCSPDDTPRPLSAGSGVEGVGLEQEMSTAQKSPQDPGTQEMPIGEKVSTPDRECAPVGTEDPYYRSRSLRTHQPGSSS